MRELPSLKSFSPEILQGLSRDSKVSTCPSLYQVCTTIPQHAVPKESSASVVYKRCLPDAVTDPVAQRIVPYTEIVQDRLAGEFNEAVLAAAGSIRLV